MTQSYPFHPDDRGRPAAAKTPPTPIRRRPDRTDERNSGILARVATGDRESMAECLTQYGDLVWSIALRYAAAREDAEEIAQETFAELWRVAGRYNPRLSSEATFIVVIARRRAIDHLRQSQRHSQTKPVPDDALHDMAERDPEATSPLTIAGLREEAERAYQAIGRLPAELQDVLWPSVRSAESQSDIAQELGLPLGTVKTRIRRALCRLRDMLRGPDEPASPPGDERAKGGTP